MHNRRERWQMTRQINRNRISRNYPTSGHRKTANHHPGRKPMSTAFCKWYANRNVLQQPATKMPRIKTYDQWSIVLNLSLQRKLKWPVAMGNATRAIVDADFLQHIGLWVIMRERLMIDEFIESPPHVSELYGVTVFCDISTGRQSAAEMSSRKFAICLDNISTSSILCRQNGSPDGNHVRPRKAGDGQMIDSIRSQCIEHIGRYRNLQHPG